MKNKVRLAATMTQTILRKGFVSLLEKTGFSNILFDTANRKEIFKNLKQKKPDILFLDVDIPDEQNHEMLEKLQKQYPRIKIIALSSRHDNDDLIVDCIKKGCRGFLSKNSEVDVLIKAIESVYETGFYCDNKIASLMPRIVSENSAHDKLQNNSPKHKQVTETERVVIALLSDNFSNKEIADKLSISTRTVETHRYHIKQKTGCRTSLDIMKYAKINNIALPE